MYVLFMARRWGMSARLGQYIESLISDSFLRELKEGLEGAQRLFGRAYNTPNTLEVRLLSRGIR